MRWLLCLLAIPSQAVLLRQWIQGLEVSIPSFELSHALAKLGITLNVTGGRCEGFQVEIFRLGPSSASAKQLNFELQLDLGFRCLVNTTLKALGTHSCDLELEAAAAVTRLGLEVSVEDGLPGQVVTTCALSPDLTKLGVLTRSLACEPLRLARQGLQDFINNVAPKLLCNQVSSHLSEFLTKASKDFRQLVSPFAKPAEVLPLPPAASSALDLREVYWEGPMGHVLRSFFKEVMHVEDPARLDEVLRFLQRDLHLQFIARHSWKAQVPWIDKMFLSFAMHGATLDLTHVEDLHFQFSAASSARLQGAVVPSLDMAAKTALLLPEDVATLHLGGYSLRLAQREALRPLELRLKSQVEVLAAAEGFVAYNASGLERLQFDQMQRASCASAYLVQDAGVPLQLLEARSAPHVHSLQVELPELELGDLELEVLQAGQELLKLFAVPFNESLARLVDGYVSLRGRAAVNEMLEESLQRSGCPASNFSSGELRAIDVPAGWSSVVFLLATLGLALVHLCWLLLRRRSHARDHGLIAQGLTQATGQHRGVTGALGWQPGVPLCLRWGMLCGIAGTTFLFVYASVTPGVLFSGSFEASGASSSTNVMASLSMENSLVQTLQVGSIFVFTAMLIFSVIWPYIKLLMMVYVWAAPVHPKSRGPLLLFLDRVGKWSLMDNIILFLFVTFFWISWTGKDVVGSGSATFALKCSPGPELNTFLAATILSLLLGHAMLWVHRWTQPKSEGSASVHLGSSRLPLLGVAQLACIVLTVVSWQVDVVEVSFDGLVATFLKVTEQATRKSYSILGILSQLGKRSTYLQVSFGVFVLAIPVLYSLSMALLCLSQLRPKKRQLLLYLCYTLNAWAAYDVFFIAFLAAVLGGERYGIGQFIELVVYQQNLAPLCGGLRDLGVQCMHVQLALQPGAALILLAVASSFVVSLLAARKMNMD